MDLCLAKYKHMSMHGKWHVFLFEDQNVNIVVLLFIFWIKNYYNFRILFLVYHYYKLQECIRNFDYNRSLLHSTNILSSSSNRAGIIYDLPLLFQLMHIKRTINLQLQLLPPPSTHSTIAPNPLNYYTLLFLSTLSLSKHDWSYHIFIVSALWLNRLIYYMRKPYIADELVFEANRAKGVRNWMRCTRN